jgi:Phage integrase family
MIYGKGGPYGTKSKHRIVPLTDRVRPLIDGHFAIHDTIGLTPRTIQRILKRVANKARINRPVSPHVLRHTFAVAAVQKGISLPALQRLLGHDRLTTTKIYLNLSPEDVLREFQEKWESRAAHLPHGMSTLMISSLSMVLALPVSSTIVTSPQYIQSPSRPALFPLFVPLREPTTISPLTRTTLTRQPF